MFDSMREKGGPLLALSEQALRLVGHWRRLCSDCLPIHTDGSIWRYSRDWLPSDPPQGWKIHLSATILTAHNVLEAVGPYLKKSGAPFKAAASLDDLARINAGLWHGYSQVGKFITIYPLNNDNFRELVNDLYRLLPADIAAPTVPFDYRYRVSNIFYRYGSFVANGKTEPTLRSPDGEMMPDRRNIPAPDWATLPFEEALYTQVVDSSSPLSNQYHVFNVISQRGKGGVYEAIDIKSRPQRICIIKEGRRHGETVWDGRDGRSRVENEATVLRDLRENGLNVPQIYDSFVASGNFYLALEEINGKNLQKLVAGRKRRRSFADTLTICEQIARVLAEIHAAGWVWRDCKPANLFVGKDGSVRPIDFEGACRINEPDPRPWSTPNFTAPEVLPQKPAKTTHSHIAEDLFSLGTCLFFVIEGKLPPNKAQGHSNNDECQADNLSRHADIRVCSLNNCDCWNVKFSRRSVPEAVKQVVSRLLSNDPEQRPGAEEVFRLLDSVQSHLPKKIGKTHVVADRIK